MGRVEAVTAVLKEAQLGEDVAGWAMESSRTATKSRCFSRWRS